MSGALLPGKTYLASVQAFNAVNNSLRLRADLEIESLPLPLQPLAYLGQGWRLTTGWTQWPLQP
jgi:hypothetical protein